MENPRKHNDNSRVSHLSEVAIHEEEILHVKPILNDDNGIEQINEPQILFVEPFNSGSHKQLIDLLYKSFPKSRLITLTGKKWPWRARCSALVLSTLIPQVSTEQILFTSSVLSLAELLGLRPDLQKLRKIVYFHENQFIYPIRQIKDRDIQFAYNQITTCLAADEIIFNSEFNLRSLLDNLHKIIKILPDYRPKDMQLKIQPKCKVLYFPVEYPLLSKDLQLTETDFTPHKRRKNDNMDCLTIVWPHRWEFDKAPEQFIDILLKLKKLGLDFRVHMLGGHFDDVPDIINDAKVTLKDNILTFGFVESKEEYYNILRSSDVVMSTAIHEFFGVAMLEATYCGCFPIVPNKLVYPEIYPAQCLYNDEDSVVKMLSEYCECPLKAGIDRKGLDSLMDFDKYEINTLLPQYAKLFGQQ